MRIFSLPNIILLVLMICANGQVMDRLPEPLRQLAGRGTAIAMSDKFDMNGMLLQLSAERHQGVAAAKKQQVRYQPYNFAEGRNGIEIHQRPFPKEELETALGLDEVPPAVRDQVNEIFNKVMKQQAVAYNYK